MAEEFEPTQFGRYILLDKLAVGGMAEIYRAKTYGVDGFEKLLAIKRILPHCSADKDFINMLVDEAKLTVLLSHANIVQVYDLGKVGNDYFISMEFINGTTLRELLNRCDIEGKRKLLEEVAVYITSEVCKGLDYAHRKTDSNGNPLNIVHRDISPQNILISYEGEVKIVDFGIAKAAMNVSHTMAGILKGKIAYMSPEQALGKPMDGRTDVFSAALMFYECLTGEKLFGGDTQFEVLENIRSTHIQPEDLPDDMPDELKRVLAKGLAHNINDRYQNAGDFQLDLTKYLYSTHADFSPRQLSALLAKMFEKELKEKKKNRDAAIDEKTRSVMIQAQKTAGSEDILIHRESTFVPGQSEATDATAIDRKSPGRKLFMAVGTVLALLGLAYVGWEFGLKKTLQEPSTAEKSMIDPSREERTPSVEEGGPWKDFGSIKVKTEPTGVKIFLNNQDTNLTSPTTLTKLKVGEKYDIRLTLDKYETIEETIKIESNQELALSKKMAPLPLGEINIVSQPAGAQIFIDDQYTGQVTPSKVDNLALNKSHTVRLSLPDHEDWSSQVNLKDFDPFSVDANLKPTPKPAKPVATVGILNLQSNPQGARVYINQQDMGQATPTAIANLSLGYYYNITLKMSGYHDWTQSFKMEQEQPPPLVANLAALPKPEPEKAKVAPKKKEQPKKKPEPKYAARTPDPEPYRPPDRVEQPRYEPPPSRVSGPAGKLKVNSKPSGAEVYINSEFRGTTPVTVSSVGPGRVKIMLSKDGFMSHRASIDLKPGDTKNLGTIELGSRYGEVRIKSNPPGATVYFDGQRIGARTPVTIRKVPRDEKHDIRVELGGYVPWRKSFTMSNSQEKMYNIVLDKQ